MKLKPNSSDTKFFKNARITRSSTLMEEEDHLMDGLFGSVTLLTLSLLWLILAAVMSSQGWLIAMWLFVGLASLCVLIWSVVHILPRLLRWFVRLIEL